MEGGKWKTMKTSFSLNDNVFQMLLAGYGQSIAERVERAVESSLNDHALVKSADAKRSDVKLKSTGKGESKRSVTTFSEAERHTYQANANGPSRFGAWHDAQVSLWSKHGDPSGELSTDVLPAHLVVWIAGFKPVATAAAPGTPEAPKVDGARPESIPTPDAGAKGNGKRNVAPVDAPKV